MPHQRDGSTDDGRRTAERDRTDPPESERDDGMHPATRWFASTAVRASLTIVGLVLLLFALGQAVGLPLLSMATDALSSRTGQWLVVAFFAILLIAAAQKGLPTD